MVIKGLIVRFKGMKNWEIRINPYVPNFSNIPASTIDPATGASTWALGSQRCVRYMGVFTRNARIVISHHNVEAGADKFSEDQNGDVRFMCPILLFKNNKDASKGKDAVTVYIMR